MTDIDLIDEGGLFGNLVEPQDVNPEHPIQGKTRPFQQKGRHEGAHSARLMEPTQSFLHFDFDS